MKHPENVKYAMVRHRPSVWAQGAKAAAVVAAIQIILMVSDPGQDNWFGVLIVFAVYWVFFTFLVWFWRALKDRFSKTPS
jgi:Na+/melibiose symporter-like transporter